MCYNTATLKKYCLLQKKIVAFNVLIVYSRNKNRLTGYNIVYDVIQRFNPYIPRLITKVEYVWSVETQNIQFKSY